MRKKLFIVLVSLLPLAAGAQQIRFGYFSYGDMIKAMPEYAVVQQNMSELRKQYEVETQREEADFNDKYEAFLEDQAELAAPILKKRQAELQELLNKSMAFKKEADRLLAQAEKDMLSRLENKLDSIVGAIGFDRGYAFILNTDGHALPFVSSLYGEEITNIVLEDIGAAAAGQQPGGVTTATGSAARRETVLP